MTTTVSVSIAERLSYLLPSHSLSGQDLVSSISVYHHTLSEMYIQRCQGNHISAVLRVSHSLLAQPTGLWSDLRRNQLTLCLVSIYHRALSSAPGSQGPQRWQRLQQMPMMSWLDEAFFVPSATHHCHHEHSPHPVFLFSRERWLLFVFAQCLCVLMAPSCSPPQPTGKTVRDDLI